MRATARGRGLARKVSSHLQWCRGKQNGNITSSWRMNYESCHGADRSAAKGWESGERAKTFLLEVVSLCRLPIWRRKLLQRVRCLPQGWAATVQRGMGDLYRDHFVVSECLYCSHRAHGCQVFWPTVNCFFLRACRTRKKAACECCQLVGRQRHLLVVFFCNLSLPSSGNGWFEN